MNARIKLTLAALALSSFALGGCVRSAGSAPNSATSSDGGAVVSTPIHFPEPSALNMPAPPAPAVIDSIPAGGSRPTGRSMPTSSWRS